MSLQRLAEAKTISVGTKQTTKAVGEGKALTVYLAADADAHIAQSIRSLCEAHHVPVITVATMIELGKACGIQVGAAMAAIIAE